MGNTYLVLLGVDWQDTTHLIGADDEVGDIAKEDS